MAIFSVAGATISIGTTTAATDATSFAADTYKEIGETETIGDFGDTAAEIQFTGLGDNRVQRLKGAFDGGTLQLTCGRDDADQGQAALLAAFASPLDYNIKIAWNNPATSGGTGGITYFRGKVMSRTLVNGTGPNNVMKRQFNIGVNSALVEVDPT